MEQTQFWLKEGTVVGGRYCLDAVLGKGGYGITYRGTDTRLEQSVAVKEYYPVFWSSRYIEKGNNVVVHQGMESQYCKGMERFLEEARLLAQLSNVPGVVRVTDYFEENGTAYLVMEFLDGKNLKEMTDQFGGRIPAQVLLPVLSPAMFALKKIHEKGLIHRDLSPDNIMMLSDGSVRLIDFGNARDTSDNKSMTMAMKEGFAAPEQYRSKGQGPYTDVYGICATIYYCLTGKLPPQAMERLMGEELIPPSRLGVEIAPWQENVILRGLDLYIQTRIPTMEELLHQLYEHSDVSAQEREPEAPAIPEVPREPAQTLEQEVVPQEPEAEPLPPEEIPAQEEGAEEYVEGKTVPLIRTSHQDEPEPPDETVQEKEEEEPQGEPDWDSSGDIPLGKTEKNIPAPKERYFVPPKPVNVPQPQPAEEESLVSRMQALCARFFGKR